MHREHSFTPRKSLLTVVGSSTRMGRKERSEEDDAAAASKRLLCACDGGFVSGRVGVCLCGCEGNSPAGF